MSSKDGKREEMLSQYGIGAKLLMKMGYHAGEGLGKRKEGIAVPLDVKMRPRGLGLAYGGFTENPEHEDDNLVDIKPDDSASKGYSSPPNVNSSSKRLKRGNLKSKFRYFSAADEPGHEDFVDTNPSTSTVVDLSRVTRRGPFAQMLKFADLQLRTSLDATERLKRERKSISSRETVLSAQREQLASTLADAALRSESLEAETQICRRIVVTAKEFVEQCGTKTSELAFASFLSTLSKDLQLLPSGFQRDRPSSAMGESLGKEFLFAVLCATLEPMSESWPIFEQPGFLVDDVESAFQRPLCSMLSERQVRSIVSDYVYPRARHTLDLKWDFKSWAYFIQWVKKWTGLDFESGQASQLRHLFSDPTDDCQRLGCFPKRLMSKLLNESVSHKALDYIQSWNPARDDADSGVVYAFIRFFMAWDDFCRDSGTEEFSDDSNGDADELPDPMEVGISTGSKTCEPVAPVVLNALKTRLLILFSKWRLSPTGDWALALLLNLSSVAPRELVQTLIKQRVIPEITRYAKTCDVSLQSSDVGAVGEWFSTGLISPRFMKHAVIELVSRFQNRLLFLLYESPAEHLTAALEVRVWTDCKVAPFKLPLAVWTDASVCLEQRKCLELVERWLSGKAKLSPVRSTFAKVERESAPIAGAAFTPPVFDVDFKGLVHQKLLESGVLSDSLSECAMDGRPLYYIANSSAAHLLEHLFYIRSNVIYIFSPKPAKVKAKIVSELFSGEIRAKDFAPVSLNGLLARI